jgi:hypothetical protein
MLSEGQNQDREARAAQQTDAERNRWKKRARVVKRALEKSKSA